MQESIHNVWLDCDPGLDDTLAIILAAKHCRINLLGLSTSAGNTSIENTTKNALDVLYNIGRSDVPVVRGSEKLVAGQIHLAQHMHGAGGLGGIIIPSSDKKAITENHFQVIRDHIMNCPEKVYWANTGALTNLCFLFREFPEVKAKIQKIVIMGGAIGRGNITPAAQFNIYFDPVAFKEVLAIKQSIPLVMIPLEVTHQVQARQRIFQFLEQRKQIPILQAIQKMLQSYKTMYKKAQNFDHPPIHDPTVINYILHPNHFEVKKTIIDVDVEKCSFGRTNCYFSHPHDLKQKFDPVDLVATNMNKRSKFWEMFEKIFSDLEKKSKQECIV